MTSTSSNLGYVKGLVGFFAKNWKTLNLDLLRL
jgi:hypothetical protein